MTIQTILTEIDAEIKRLQHVRKLLASTDSQTSSTKPATKKRNGTMSAEGRKRIAEAQRKRWAKRKAAKT